MFITGISLFRLGHWIIFYKYNRTSVLNLIRLTSTIKYDKQSNDKPHRTRKFEQCSVYLKNEVYFILVFLLCSYTTDVFENPLTNRGKIVNVITILLLNKKCQLDPMILLFYCSWKCLQILTKWLSGKNVNKRKN